MRIKELEFVLISAFFFAMLVSVSIPAVSSLQETNYTLIVTSKPGGSIVVNSSAINGGRNVTVKSGQTQNWTVPNGTSVTLTATNFASGLDFKGWDGPLNGNPHNPGIITVNGDVSIAGYFDAYDAPNVIYLTLQSPKISPYNKDRLDIT